MCTPCPNSLDSYTLLDRPLFPVPPTIAPIPKGWTCGQIKDLIPVALSADDEKCPLVQQLVGTQCGCPTTARDDNACVGLCDSYDSSAHVAQLYLHHDDNNDENCPMLIEQASCQFAQAFLQSLEDESDKCTQLTAEWGAECGCSVNGTSSFERNNEEQDLSAAQRQPDHNKRAATCSICLTGDPVGAPDKSLARFFTQQIVLDLFPERLAGILENLNTTLITCGLADELLRSSDEFSSVCGLVERTFLSGICECPPVDNACQFCPTHDLTRPNYTTPVFSVRTEIKGGVCADMEDILTQVDRTDYMCWTARHQNAHQCGCNGGVAWYLGADTKRKHAVLTWVPRVSGFLSLLGSGFILYDIIRNHKQSITTYHWLVMGMSFFDLFSSMAWVVSSLAVPEEDYTGETGTYAAAGNDATCKAQGFFLELGAIGSTSFNASLTVFYVLSIVHNFPNSRIISLRKYLLGVPVLVALAVACAGIPFYQGYHVVCTIPANRYMQKTNYGTSLYYIFFSVLPISIATVISFGNLLIICRFVYRRSRAANRWRFPSTGASTSNNHGRRTAGSGEANNAVSQPESAGRLSFWRMSSRNEANISFSENESARIRARRKPESIVFWQAFWYVIFFLLTWVIYLVGQIKPYVSANDETIFAFWVVLLALNPLMGLWNAIVYVKPWTWEKPVPNQPGQNSETRVVPSA